MFFNITRNSQTVGTFDLNQIGHYLLTGHLLPTDTAWHPAVNQWVALISLPELQGVMQQLEMPTQMAYGNQGHQPQSTQPQYYVLINNQPYGFNTFTDVVHALQSGGLSGNESVCRAGDQVWSTFTALAEFHPYIRAPHQQPSPPAQSSPEPSQPRTRKLTTKPCGVCGGAGIIGSCQNCRGIGTERTWNNPPYSGESGRYDDLVKELSTKPCSVCSGKGTITCSRCNGSKVETVLE